MASTKTVVIIGVDRWFGYQFALQYREKGFNVYSPYRKGSVGEAKKFVTAGKEGSLNWIDATPEELTQHFKINAISSFLVTKNFYPQLKKSSNLVVINLSSQSGKVTGHNLSYRASKAALNMIIVDIARELAPDKITVIAMSPQTPETSKRNPDAYGDIVADDVPNMIHVIDRVDFSDTGRFLGWDGTSVAW